MDVPLPEPSPTPAASPTPTPQPTPEATPATAADGVVGTAPVEFPPPPPPPCPAEPVDTLFAPVGPCAGLLAEHEGIDSYLGTGQAWADVNGDGRLDLFVTHDLGPNTLWLQTAPGLFEPADAPALAASDLTSGGATFADYDNDGDPDLFVANVGPNQLFRNDGGSWVDVASPAVAGEDKSYHGVWADYDADGLLDLYVVNYCSLDCPWDAVGHDRLLRGTPDGQFDDVSDLLPADSRSGYGLTAAWFDMDDDGDQDLYVVNDKGRGVTPEGGPYGHNALFRNDGPGCGSACFTDTSIGSGADLAFEGMGVATGDVDGDGDLDVYVSDGSHSTLLQNLGDGSFVDVTLTSGVEQGRFSWAAVLFDYDNDGWLDLAVAAGVVDDDRDNRDLLFRNLGGTFEDVSDGSGVDGDGISLGLAAADYDRDGRVDLLTGDRFDGFGLARNVAPGGSSLLVDLVGAGPVARDAVGARATLIRADGVELVREVQNGGSFGGGSERALHFGLGSSTAASLSVRWPDGTVQSVAVPADGRLVVTYQP